MTLPTYLRDAARAHPDATAIATLDSSLAYGDLEKRARHIAHTLIHRWGLDTGDRVAIAMNNDPSYIEVLFGAWYAGLCVAPMNSRLHARELAALIADCDAKICFASPEIAAALSDQSAPTTRIAVTPRPAHDEFFKGHTLERPVEASPDSPAWLFYTSGTTGRPKGATLTHRNLTAMVESFLADSGAATDDALLHVAPLSHAGGLIGLAYVAQALPQFVPPAKLTSGVLAHCLSRVGRASFFAVPTLLRRMMDPAYLDPTCDKHIAKILFGGAPMYAADLKAAIDRFGPNRLWGAYGQGEAPCTITHLSSTMLADEARPDYEDLLASVGIARTGVHVRVVDEQGNVVPPGTMGEVVVQGDVVMAGYWNLPEATSKTVRDGWLFTGDLGRMTEAGLLTLVDRSKDLIISGGSNIYPREIEEVLLRHPRVAAAAVVGGHDPEWGETPVAFVVADGPVDASALDAFCLERIARFKRPKKYLFVKDLPKSTYGKVLKSELRSMLASNHQPD